MARVTHEGGTPLHLAAVYSDNPIVWNDEGETPLRPVAACVQ